MINSIIKSYAKLNLALNVIGKQSNFHKIETIVAFNSLHDKILIKDIKSKKHNIIFIGKFSNNIGKNNTVSKLLKILEIRKLIKNRKFKIVINKRIPNRAGLGGGSMNAASILKYFIKKKVIKLSKKELTTICGLIGSDVVLGLETKYTILSTTNKVKYFNNYKKFYTLIVKPNFGCSTKDIYSMVSKFNRPKFSKPVKSMLSLNYLKRLSNFLEPVAFSKYKNLKKIKSFLEKLYDPAFVRMTGSGSALVAYFQSKKSCINAQKLFKKKYKNYWSIASKTI